MAAHKVQHNKRALGGGEMEGNLSHELSGLVGRKLKQLDGAAATWP